MADEFRLHILTSAAELFNQTVSEVVLPGHDGERGILGGHENFVGLLGTGALKLVREGNDYWVMVSSGLYQVDAGVVTILAELAEPATDIEFETASAQGEELKSKLEQADTLSEEYNYLTLELLRAQARADVYRRTNLVN